MPKKFAEKTLSKARPEPVQKPEPGILASVTLDASQETRFTPWILEAKPSSMLNKKNRDMSIGTWAQSEEVGKAINFATLTPEQQDRIKIIQIPIRPDAALTQEQLQHLKNTITTFFKRHAIPVHSMDELHNDISELNVATDKNTGNPVAKVLEFRLDSHLPISNLGIKGDKLRNALVELSTAAQKARETGASVGI